MTHTKTPWYPVYGNTLKTSPDGAEQVMSAADVIFANRAVNCHEDLLEAARDVVQQAERSKIMLPADLADSIRVLLKAAIRKAEPQP